MGVPRERSVCALRLCGSACDGAAPATVRDADQALASAATIRTTACTCASSLHGAMHILTRACACHVLEVMARDRLQKEGRAPVGAARHGRALSAASPLVGFVCGVVRRPTVTRVSLALVLFFVGCLAVPSSLGAFGWAARFVGTLLFAGLPIAFQNWRTW